MSGLICTPSIVPPPAAEGQATIVNDGFLPNIDPDTVKLNMRIAAGIGPERVRTACINAMLRVAPDLAAWCLLHQADGHATLADVPAPTLDGMSRLVLLYNAAVGAFAKAELIERHRDVDQAGGAQRDADASDPTVGDLRRDARHAIRDLLGRTRTCVELI